MINFSRLNLVEGTEAVDAAASSAEKAKSGGEKQINDTQRRKDRQKSQMSQPTSTDTKSDVSYTSEEYQLELERTSSYERNKSDWRQELTEKFKDDPQMHPYVDVMPFMNQKADELKRQMKDAAKMQGMKQAKMAEGASNPFQVHFDKDGKSYTSKGSKESRDRITRNIASNRKSGPLAKDPYRARAGESD